MILKINEETGSLKVFSPCAGLQMAAEQILKEI